MTTDTVTNSLEHGDPLDDVTVVPVVPLDDRLQVDADAFATHLARLTGAGIRSFVVGGHTGEFHSLTDAESAALAGIAADVLGAGRRDALLIGVGRDLPSACAAAANAARLGCRGVLVHQPSQAGVSPDGYRDYVAAVARAGGGDIVLYLTDAAMVPALPELLTVDGVVGVKWGIPNRELWSAARAHGSAAPRPVRFVCGLAERAVPDYCDATAPGFTSGIANVHPALSLRLRRTGTVAGPDADGIERFESLRARDRGRLSVSAVKALVELTAGMPARVRPPLVLPTSGELDELRTVLAMWRLTTIAESSADTPTENDRA